MPPANPSPAAPLHSHPGRPGEAVCTCPAYPHPHRFGGGRCNGLVYIRRYFDGPGMGGCHGECRTCPEQPDCPGDSCAPYDGRETAPHCQAIQDLVMTYGIKPPAPWRQYL